MKASVFTLGCRVNQYESDGVAEMLSARGFEIVPFGERCDITIINTCTVTAESDRKSRQHIRRAMKISPDGAVIVTGCYAQIDPEGAQKAGAAAVVGNGEKSAIADVALEILAGKRGICCVGDIANAEYDPMGVTEPSKARAFVKIEDGCENRCAYCIIPKARGGVRSRNEDDIIEEIRTIAQKGYKEIILTGIETASYGKDTRKTDLASLIARVSEIEGVERLTLGSLEPTVMTEEFCEKIAKSKKLLPHFHLSLQSGCTKTLNRMRRRYTAERAERSVELVRKYMPDATFSADVIVGFPGETDDDFAETLEFFKKARFLHLHIFPYSIRDGTEAAEMPDQVPEQVKKQRARELDQVQNTIKEEFIRDYINKHGENDPVYVLLETFKDGVANGHTEHFLECDIETPRERTGEIVKVALTGCSKKVLKGQALN